MSGGKYVKIEIDTASWTTSPGGVPSELAALNGKRRKIPILPALLHTGILTRPPTSTGIDLADYWAWLRYGPAIDDLPELKLRAAWKDIDPHQKNILSDDLGMGLTTYLLSRALKFKSIADTIHFAKVAHPGLYHFLKMSKNGQHKSPDFVAMDNAGDPENISVIECKGTQSSKPALRELMKRGVEQKENLLTTAGGSASIKHRLVAGLLIPPSDQSFEAIIRLCDPEFSEFNSALAQIPPERKETAIVQVDLAKHFALMSLYSISRALATTNTREQKRLPDIDRDEARRLPQVPGSVGHTFTIEHPLSDRTQCEGLHVRGVRFTMTSPAGLYESLVESQDLDGTLTRLAGRVKESEWEESSQEAIAKLVTPLGFSLTLEYLQ